MSAASDAQLLSLTGRLTTLTAQHSQMKADYNESLDTIWMLLASMLVFFMHAGFSLLEAGCVRFKNTQNILVKNLLVVTCGFLCWFVFGYAFAFGAAASNPNKFSGQTGFFMMNFDPNAYRFWFFQGAFCATGATIVSGAMAERTQLKGFALYTVLMTTVIYPIVVYWGWSGAGIFNYAEGGASHSLVGPALMDFAGSGLVHMVGGVGALVGAAIVGPRAGRFDGPKEIICGAGVVPNGGALVGGGSEDFVAHNIPYCVLGTFFLWFGWYGFNPGSTGSMHDRGTANSAGIVAVNTTLSPCCAGLVVFLIRFVRTRKLDIGGFCNGILAGLVAITAGCANVQPWETLFIGCFGGCIYQGASMLVAFLKVDDVVDAFAVHGATGLWGILALGLFGDPAMGIGGNGAFYGGNQLGTQIFAGLMITLWVSSLSVMVLLPLKLLGLLRLDDEFQSKGADNMEHSPTKAYNTGTKSTE